jgi:hypothetical protein
MQKTSSRIRWSLRKRFIHEGTRKYTKIGKCGLFLPFAPLGVTSWIKFLFLRSIVLGMFLITAQATWAQSAPGPEANRRPPETAAPKSPPAAEPGLRFLSSEMTVSGRVVKHAPYSAEILTESSQTLGNGATLNRRINGKIYRDSDGRTRREMSAVLAGPFATNGDAQRMVFINDPVSGLSSTFIPDGEAARVRPLASNPDLPSPPDIPTENSRIEPLGKQMIEGFEAEGERTTILIPVGRIGNDKSIEIIHERWYSPELQTLLLSKHSDPRWGETTYKLLNIHRGEPDRSLFSLPAPIPPDGKKVRPRR